MGKYFYYTLTQTIDPVGRGQLQCLILAGMCVSYGKTQELRNVGGVIGPAYHNGSVIGTKRRVPLGTTVFVLAS